MSVERKDCGCVIRHDERTINPCRSHDIEMFALSWLHDEGHEECCDLPMLRRAMGDYGFTLDDIEEATDVLHERSRPYALSLVWRLRDEQ